MITYKINTNELEKNYKSFAEYGEIYFPVKTNHNKYILNKLGELGAGFECDSIDHIKKIYKKKIADKIIFSNVAKDDYDIKWAVDHGLSFYTVDDLNTLNKIFWAAKKKKMKKLRINVRLNVYEVFRKEFEEKNIVDSRLGASVITLKKLLDVIENEKDLVLEKGISFYVQVEVHNKEDSLRKVLDFIATQFSNYSLDFINIGGGNSLEKLKNHKEFIDRVLNKMNAKRLILEPGRHMVDEVENLCVKAKRIIETDLNNGECIVSLFAGIYHGLFDIKLHNRKFEIAVDNCILKEYDGVGKKIVLRGPTADSSDIIGVYNMPKCELNKDSIFTFKNVGAYVEVFHSDFSGKIKIENEMVDSF